MTVTPTVLIVDDEPALLDLYAAWLEDLDVEVLRANRGTTAIDRCNDADVDVAMLDRQMPCVSGDEVLDVIRDPASTTRIAFITAMTPSVRIVDLDIDAYLLKPVRRPEFVALVRSLLGRRRLSDPVERYVSALSKRAALLKTESPAILRSDPTYAAFLRNLSQLARRVDRRPDDPYLDRILPDAGHVETPPETTE